METPENTNNPLNQHRPNNRQGLFILTKKHEKAGRVFLVGAGPGDPGLITIAALRRLRTADVIVHDALANPLLLDEARADAQRIDVGKRGGDHKLTQDQINDLLVEKARAGCDVVRLKGGDPYLFGRGGEEISYLAQRGVACEMIPGITSGIAAPAAAGIPVTHRRCASTVTFVTGHEDPTKTDSAVDYHALAQLIAAGGTVCFYMGAKQLTRISQTLIECKLDAQTPAAIVQWGTLPTQQHLRSTIGNLPAQADAQGIGAPAIIVVGPVAAIDEPGLDYFTKRPLFGQRILVTRTRQQASQLRQKLTDLGAAVLEAPTIELVEPDGWEQVDEALANIGQYDWLVLTSVNAVLTLAQRLEMLQCDARHMHGVSIAAIGDATADTLREKLAVTADLVPTRFVGESLAGELIVKHGVKDKRMLLLQADIARPTLAELLSEAGGHITQVTAYQTKPATALPDDVREALHNGQIDWVTFTSASTGENLVALLGDDKQLLDDIKIASIGPITSEALRGLGLSVTVEATTSNIASLVDAMVEAQQP
jgi:uroporphyrinogen III methyltransferase/synthase